MYNFAEKEKFFVLFVHRKIFPMYFLVILYISVFFCYNNKESLVKGMIENRGIYFFCSAAEISKGPKYGTSIESAGFSVNRRCGLQLIYAHVFGG